MGLSRFPDASKGGAMAFFMIYAALCISTVKGILISLLQKMGVKADTGTQELAEEESSDLSPGISQLAMTAEEREDRLPVALLETSSSLCSCSNGDGVSEGVEFHGGEEIRNLSCDHVFHKSCVDKGLLDYENMTCLFCGLCLINVSAKHDGR
jgi:hypothetical protein